MPAKQFKPPIFKAIINRLEYNITIDAGRRENPQVFIDPIPIDINFPVEVPVQTPIPITNAALERWKLTNKIVVRRLHLSKIRIERKNETIIA